MPIWPPWHAAHRLFVSIISTREVVPGQARTSYLSILWWIIARCLQINHIEISRPKDNGDDHQCLRWGRDTNSAELRLALSLPSGRPQAEHSKRRDMVPQFWM